MKRTQLLSTTTLAAASMLGAVAFAAGPTAAQSGQPQQAQASKQQKGEKIDLTTWSNQPLYAGFSAETFLDAEVYDQDGEQIGEVEDMIVNPDGTVQALVIEAGGFLDIGDTHFAYPFKKARILSTDAVRVQFDEDNLDAYSMFRDLDERPVTGRNWKITELIDDYAYLHDRRAYGWVDDVILGWNGQVRAVIVSPDAAYGVGGPYAWPYYGYGGGWEPGLDYYAAPYTAEEIAVIDEFDPAQMQTQQTASAGSGAAAGTSQPSGQSAQASGKLVGQKVTSAKGKEIGSVVNSVSEDGEQYVVIALAPEANVTPPPRMLVKRSELKAEGDRLVWSSERAENLQAGAADGSKQKRK